MIIIKFIIIYIARLIVLPFMQVEVCIYNKDTNQTYIKKCLNYKKNNDHFKWCRDFYIDGDVTHIYIKHR